ncbi:MAG TPA: hypothetical protein PKV93_14850 [Fervidobacterium sp.]|nr:hypothetical protein [Fervidobacterium sp.]
MLHISPPEGFLQTRKDLTAASRGDLLFLYSDIYSLNPDFEQLMMEMNIILIRDSEDAPWEIVDQGY